jgi:hypothetical protein
MGSNEHDIVLSCLTQVSIAFALLALGTLISDSQGHGVAKNPRKSIPIHHLANTQGFAPQKALCPTFRFLQN